MLEIINQDGLTLQPDIETVIPVEVYNPLFGDSNELFQELVYSAQAGLTPINKAFINNGHLIESSNDAYEFPVRVLYKGSSFFQGLFRYKIVDETISFDLKVNFGTVATKVKTTMLRDIVTMDPYAIPPGETAESMMKKTCVNPGDYPFAFFPIKNMHWRDDSVQAISYPWMNYWDHAAQKFTIVTGGTRPIDVTLQIPFFKLSYILSLIFKYLDFSLEGEILSTEDFNSIYVFTKRLGGLPLLSTMNYLPAELTIGEFLKQVSARLKLNFNYNLANNSVYVGSVVSSLNYTDVDDISAYVEKVNELSTSEKKGYTVTLKVDTDDQALDSAPEGSDKEIFKPLSTLIVGSGETPVEMEIGTLKEYQDTDYSYPITDQLTNLFDASANVNWPIRLLKYTGMKALPGGKVFPQASAYDLGEDDATFYRFSNDCKKVVLTAKVPPGVLAAFTPTTKFGFISKEGTYVRAMNVKYAYSLPGYNTERVTVKIECLTIVTDFKTPFSIEKVTSNTPGNGTDPDTTGLTVKLRYKFCYADGSQPAGAFTLQAFSQPGETAEFGLIAAAAPSDNAGVGGKVGIIHKISGDRYSTTYFNIRVYDKVPKHFIVNGTIYYFAKEGNYYTSPVVYPLDDRPLLVVF